MTSVTDVTDEPDLPEVRTYDGLAAEIYTMPPRLGEVRLVTVDGPSGSGKTEFARRLVPALSAYGSVVVVGMECLYEGWTLDGSWQRLLDWVLEPVAAGWAGGFHPYDWATMSWSPNWFPVPPSDVLVLEGCGSSPLAADAFTTHRIWVEAASELTLARGLAREGVDLDRRLAAWRRLEAAHFAEQATRERADLRVDGDPGQPLAYDPGIAFSTLH